MAIKFDGSDESIRLQGRCASRAEYNRHQLHFMDPRDLEAAGSIRPVDVVSPEKDEDGKEFVGIINDGDFRPLTFVSGTEALKDGAPARRSQRLPAVTVHRRGYNLRYAD